MRLVLWVIALGAAAVALGWWLSNLAGVIHLTLGSYQVDLATSLAIVAMAVLVALLLGLLALLGWLLGTGRRVARWRARRTRTRGDESVTRTLVALAAGEQAAARKESRRARVALGDTPQTLLLAAEAERLSGDETAAAALYTQMSERDDAGLLGLRGLLRQAINRQDWDSAAEIARRAERVHPGGTWLREERAALAVRAGDWRQAQALAAPDAPGATYAVAAAEAAADPDEALRLARAAYKDHPAFAPAALAYARALQAGGRDGRAADVLRDAWGRAALPAIADLALAADTDPAARLKRATRLVSGNATDPETCLLLARLQLDAGSFAEARRQLELARPGADAQRRFWLLLADLEGAERGATEIGQIAQRDALRHAAGVGRDPAWHCETCGTEVATWRPTCPHCGTTGRVRWGVGRDVAVLMPAGQPIGLRS